MHDLDPNDLAAPLTGDGKDYGYDWGDLEALGLSSSGSEGEPAPITESSATLAAARARAVTDGCIDASNHVVNKTGQQEAVGVVSR